MVNVMTPPPFVTKSRNQWRDITLMSGPYGEKESGGLRQLIEISIMK